MRYGKPSMESVLARLREQGCERILCFPLYPQYAAATTASVNDKLFEALLKTRYMPAIRTVPQYHDEPVYIEALARSIEKHLRRSISSRRKLSPPIMASLKAISKRAIRTIATA